jgi:hypothetical protein
MHHAIEMGWFIINKYYTMTEQVPVYAASLLLDPSRRAAYIQQHWPESWYEPAINAAKAVWEAEHKSFIPEAPAEIQPMPPPSKRTPNQLDLIMNRLKVKSSESKQIDDFMTFIEAPVIDLDEDTTPLQWWCRLEQRRLYPKLSRMAIAILSIPAESSEPERSFSGARRTCSWDRLRLACTTIEIIELIGNWLREGHITPLYLNGMGLPMDELVDDEAGSTPCLSNELLDLIEWT